MSVWKGGVWASQKFPGGSGVWKGGVWASQRSATATQVLRNLLFGSGQQGVFYVPQPTVDGQQVLYQDSAGTTPVTADGQPVGYIKDLSGNGNHATQATASNKGLYRLTGGRNRVNFDGVDDFMDAVINMPQPFTVSVAVKVTGNTEFVYSTTDGTGTNRVDLLCVDDTAPDWRIYAGGTVIANGFYTPSETVVITAIFNGASSVLRKNGAVIATGNVGTSTLEGLRLMASYALGKHAPGDLFGYINREGVLGSTEIDAVETYLADLSGVTL